MNSPIGPDPHTRRTLNWNTGTFEPRQTIRFVDDRPDPGVY